MSPNLRIHPSIEDAKIKVRSFDESQQVSQIEASCKATLHSRCANWATDAGDPTTWDRSHSSTGSRGLWCFDHQMVSLSFIDQLSYNNHRFRWPIVSGKMAAINRAQFRDSLRDLHRQMTESVSQIWSDQLPNNQAFESRQATVSFAFSPATCSWPTRFYYEMTKTLH